MVKIMDALWVFIKAPDHQDLYGWEDLVQDMFISTFSSASKKIEQVFCEEENTWTMMEGEAPTQERVFQVKIHDCHFLSVENIFVKYFCTGVPGSQTMELELQMNAICIPLFSALHANKKINLTLSFSWVLKLSIYPECHHTPPIYLLLWPKLKTIKLLAHLHNLWQNFCKLCVIQNITQFWVVSSNCIVDIWPHFGFIWLESLHCGVKETV